MRLLDPVLLAVLSVLCALAFITLAGLWATVEILGWLRQRDRTRRLCDPVLMGADLDATVPPCDCPACTADDLELLWALPPYEVRS